MLKKVFKMNQADVKVAEVAEEIMQAKRNYMKLYVLNVDNLQEYPSNHTWTNQFSVASVSQKRSKSITYIST